MSAFGRETSIVLACAESLLMTEAVEKGKNEQIEIVAFAPVETSFL
jgi:hypothetical protein